MRSSALLHWSSALFVSQAVCQKLIFDKKRRTKRPGKSHRAPVSCFSLLIYFFEPRVARLVFDPRVARASTDTLRSLRTRSRGLPTVRKNVNEVTKRHRWFTKWFSRKTYLNVKSHHDLQPQQVVLGKKCAARLSHIGHSYALLARRSDVHRALSKFTSEKSLAIESHFTQVESETQACIV